jgi:hypothetical protein
VGNGVIDEIRTPPHSYFRATWCKERNTYSVPARAAMRNQKTTVLKWNDYSDFEKIKLKKIQE